MTNHIDRVHIIFKTHLDVGFTDYARNVVNKYFTQFIPQAVGLARQLRESNSRERFRWTVGSWLVYEHLEHADPPARQIIEDAINAGDLVWHGLPFTTHTEIMDATLLRFGLKMARSLDERFGTRTISAKMTDVPGHTRAMIPVLAEAGIKFLHIGVNPAATVPDVPPIFRWHDSESDTSIIVMYQQVYGDVMVLPGTSQAVALIFTGDNLGPPSIDDIEKTYETLRQQFPEAELMASTLDNVAQVIIDSGTKLPVITQEIGDTWIQGVGTDPLKVSWYRELLRLRDEWLRDNRIDNATLTAFHRNMIMIPEHTWGMDLKTHLQDYTHYETEVLERMRSEPNFQRFEASWQEQRDYITDTIRTLEGTPLHGEARQRLESLKPHQPDLAPRTCTAESHFETEHWTLEIDRQTGALIGLLRRADGTTWADADHPIGLMRYENFSTDDYERYWHQYIRDREHGEIRIWAHPDNVKPGLDVKEHQMWQPVVRNIYHRTEQGEDFILVEATWPENSLHTGAPRQLYLEYCVSGAEEISMSARWFEKPACRLPEAFWMTFRPLLSTPENWKIQKLGQWISPVDVISRGARTLHATLGGMRCEDEKHRLTVETLDAVLVAPGQPSLLNFHNQLPDLTLGMHVNLLNNIWGTNFPMWYEDDALFRFVLRIEGKAQ